MRTRSLATIFLATVVMLSFIPMAYSGDWEMIGEKLIRKADKTAYFEIANKETNYTEIKLSIKNFGTTIHSITIYSTDGKEYVFRINNYIQADTETAPISLPEGGLSIQKVKIKYYVRAIKRAVIELWGRSAG